MSRTDTWMPLYIADYIADTVRLSTAEHGAYLLLLMEYWRKGPLPDDDRVLATVARADRKLWGEIGPTVREFFTLEPDGRLHQKRVDEEKTKAQDLSQKRRDAALQRGAVPRQPPEYDGHPKGAAWRRADRLTIAREKGRHTEGEWAALLLFCGGRCLKCGSTEEIARDHIISIESGEGSDAIDNIQPLCTPCNSGKGSKKSYDLRPNGWQEAVARVATGMQTASKQSANGEQNNGDAECLQAGLHDSLSRDLSPFTKEEVKPSRAYANVGCGLRGMEDATPDPKNGRPTCGGHYLDVCIERVNDAARIDTSRWRGDYRPLMKWLDVEHIDPEIIFRVMKRKSAYKDYQVPTSLSWFKPAIDEELGRKPS